MTSAPKRQDVMQWVTGAADARLAYTGAIIWCAAAQRRTDGSAWWSWKNLERDLVWDWTMRQKEAK